MGQQSAVSIQHSVVKREEQRLRQRGMDLLFALYALNPALSAGVNPCRAYGAEFQLSHVPPTQARTGLERGTR